jgi:arylsulfatase A-like enzyme
MPTRTASDSRKTVDRCVPVVCLVVAAAATTSEAAVLSDNTVLSRSFAGYPMRTPICLLMLVILCGSLQADAANHPNVVLVMCDDLGWGDVGFNGNKVIRTPHLDAMSRGGLKFNRFYAQAPVCSPTRGSCITGRHPYRYGVYFANIGHMRPEELTLAEILRDHGYTTGHFGKWHLGTLSKTVRESNRGGPRGKEHFSPPQANGFDVCFSTEAKVPTFDPMWKPAGRAGNAWNALVGRDKAVPYGTHYWNEQGEIVSDNLDGDNSRVIMDRAIPFITKAVRRDQPFFAIVWFHTPHLPVVAAPRHREMYREHPDVLAGNYFGCITAMDEQVGRLRAELRACGAADNTMLWFCSDNGPEGDHTAPGSAGHLRGRKRSLYEGGIRVPGVLEWPGHAKPGQETNFPAVTSDYFPTILDALKISYQSSRPLDGVSLLPVLNGKMSERPRPIGFQSRQQIALTDNRFKLVGHAQRDRWELFDLLADPSEQKNVADEHAAVAQSMISQLGAWRASCDASDRGEDYSPRFEGTTVFQNETEGYNGFRIPAVIRASGGDLLAFCEARAGGDASEIDLVMKRSEDRGQTWGPLQVIQESGDFRAMFGPNAPPITVGNPAPVVDAMDPQHPGRIWLPFTLENDRVFVTYSDDQGRTWSPRREITANTKRLQWGWYATGPVHSIQIQRGPHRGRLVIPADHRLGVGGEDRGANGAQAILSDDHGKTWRLGAVDDSYDDPLNANETTVVELNDGRLYFNTRDQNGEAPGTRGSAYSQDGGETFDAATLSGYRSFTPSADVLDPPVVQCCLLRAASTLDGDELNLILFSGPDESGPSGKGRSDLRIRYSLDETKSWIDGPLIHEGPAAYSDLVRLAPNEYGILFEAGDQGQRRYDRIDFVRFRRQQLGLSRTR